MELRERASGPKADLSMRPARSGGGAPTGSTRLERAYRLDVRAKIIILRERVGLTVRERRGVPYCKMCNSIVLENLG